MSDVFPTGILSIQIKILIYFTRVSVNFKFKFDWRNIFSFSCYFMKIYFTHRVIHVEPVHEGQLHGTGSKGSASAGLWPGRVVEPGCCRWWTWMTGTGDVLHRALLQALPLKLLRRPRPSSLQLHTPSTAQPCSSKANAAFSSSYKFSVIVAFEWSSPLT